MDFYSGFVYDMLGIPVELYTPIFAVARIVGWSAHRMEELSIHKIIRPPTRASCRQGSKGVPLEEIKEKKREKNFRTGAKVLFWYKAPFGAACRQSLASPAAGWRPPRPTFPPERGRREDLSLPGRVYGIRGASGTPPPTTGYVNPSKTTFSSAQMFSCEAL